MKQVDWFFDFVSPYSYLQCERLDDLPDDVELIYRPVLFAGLLKHWQHKGPAEIPGKRRFTYRSTVWMARKLGMPLKFPRAHPFNPLPLLRLCVALENRPDVVRDLFRFVWRDGKLPQDPEDWSRLIKLLNAPDADSMIASDQVKAALRGNAEYAIENGVFGVPTFLVEGEIFWGSEFFDFLMEYLRDPSILQEGEIARVSELPVQSSRV